MASPSSNEAFLMIRQDETGRPHQIIRYDTNEGTYVASSIAICREMLKNPRVKTAFKELAVNLDPTSKAWNKDLPKDEVVKIFIDKIMERFPIVFVDHSLTNVGYRSVHWRRRAPGAYGTSFDTRTQSIVINGVIIDNTCLAGVSAQGIEDPDAKERKRFRVFLFSIAVSLLHELGHVFVTFLGGGKIDTPPHVDAQVHVKSVGSSDTRGEPGAYLEYMTFGGTMTLLRDPAQDDRQPGIPYLIKEKEVCEILQKTVDEFVNCQFIFPFSNLGPKRPAGMRTVGQDLPWITSKRNPVFEPETQELLAGRSVNPYNVEEFEQDIDNLLKDNPNPKTLSAHQASVMCQIPFDPSLRIESSA